ncbi:hypothetical protein BaRGS_00019346, partial [Batillaria attramentaria]
RQGYNIDEAEVQFAQCLDTHLNNLPSGAQRDALCSAFADANACVEGVKNTAYLPQRDYFDAMFAAQTTFFTEPPNNCTATATTTTTLAPTTTTTTPTTTTPTTTTSTTTTTAAPPAAPAAPPPTTTAPPTTTTMAPTTTATTPAPAIAPTTTTSSETTTAAPEAAPAGGYHPPAVVNVGDLPEALGTKLAELLADHVLASWTIVGEGSGANVVVVMTLTGSQHPYQ